jgi:Ca-activated chloride channel family protein
MKPRSFVVLLSTTLACAGQKSGTPEPVSGPAPEVLTAPADLPSPEPTEDLATRDEAPAAPAETEAMSSAPPPASRALARPSAAGPSAAGKVASAPKSKKEAATDDRTEVSTGGEAYAAVSDNPFRSAEKEPLSTFSIDVDTASYANVRRYLSGGSLPPPDAVRIEELVNYFTYDYAQPKGTEPFAVDAEVAVCPWNPEHKLARIALKGREIPAQNRKPGNLVFLLDVSGSMSDANKLPLLKAGLKMLVKNLNERDKVAIVVYAGAEGMALPSTPCTNKQTIIEALDRLESGGSTNAGAGIELAYKTAQENFIQGGVNRVILATDGDFNVGVTSQDDLVKLIEQKAKQGVFVTVLGLGMGNYKDSTLELLADKGNGNYAYIDTEAEARKVLVEQMGATLVTIAKDVKIQVEFNPATVAAYRLVGYENRVLAAEDFTDDKKDAGEIGAGHTVTAFYELVEKGKEGKLELGKVVATDVKPEFTFKPGQIMVVKLRYKEPAGSTSKPLAFPVADSQTAWAKASADFRFAAAVAAYGMLLRTSPHKAKADWKLVVDMAESGKGKDTGGYRAEFIELARKAGGLQKK